MPADQVRRLHQMRGHRLEGRDRVRRERRSRKAPMSGNRFIPFSRIRWISANGTVPSARASLLSGRSTDSPRAPGPVHKRLSVRQADVVSSAAVWATSPPRNARAGATGSLEHSRARMPHPPRTRRASSRRRPPRASRTDRAGHRRWRRSRRTPATAGGGEVLLLPVHPGISRTCATGSDTRMACVAKGPRLVSMAVAAMPSGRSSDLGALIGRAGPSAPRAVSAHSGR